MWPSKLGLKRKPMFQAFLFALLCPKLQKVIYSFVIIFKSYINFGNFLRVYGNPPAQFCLFLFPNSTQQTPDKATYTQDKPLSDGLQHSVVRGLSEYSPHGTPARGSSPLQGGVWDGQPGQLSRWPLLCRPPASCLLHVDYCLLPGATGSASAADKPPSRLPTLLQAVGTCS